MTTNTTYTSLAAGVNGLTADDLLTVTGSSTTPWNGTYTINDNWSITGTGTGTGISAPATVKITGKGIVLEDDADIQIKGRQLSEVLAGIESRLGLLTANHQLEAEFAELQALGDQYRELERRLNEQLKTWDILKRE